MLNLYAVQASISALCYWKRQQATRVRRTKNTLPEHEITADGGAVKPLRQNEIDEPCQPVDSSWQQLSLDLHPEHP